MVGEKWDSDCGRQRWINNHPQKQEAGGMTNNLCSWRELKVLFRSLVEHSVHSRSWTQSGPEGHTHKAASREW